MARFGLRDTRRSITREALRVAGVYAVVAALWIVLSDRAVSWYAGAETAAFQTGKGLLFVAFTALLVYWQSVRSARRLEALHRERTAAEWRLESLLAAVEDGLLLLDDELRVIQASPSTARLLGAEAEALAGHPVTALFAGGARDAERLGLWHLPPGRFTVGEIAVTRIDGEQIPVRASIGNVEGPKGRILVMILHDLRDDLAARTALDLDPATGQLRPEALRFYVDELDGPLWLVLLRLDPTAPMILGLGRPSLDELLADQGTRLLASGAAAIGRWDNATTIGVFPGAVGSVDPAELAPQAEELVRALSERVPLQGRLVTIPMTAGFVRREPGAATAAAELVHRAEIAQQAAWRSHRRWVIYEHSVGDEARRTAELELDLRLAVDQGLLEAHFQTIHDARTRRVVAVETLCRWNRLGHGFVPPDEFIPLAEQSDLIESLDLLMMRTACAQAVTWPDPAVAVTVNLAARTLLCGDLPDRVATCLRSSGLPADRLVLEVTEHGLATDSARVERSLAAIRETGVRVAIDDFGAGYSSLDRLLHLPVDQWKIDRSLVPDVARPERRAFVEAIASVATSLGRVTVAEGVETPEQMGLLVGAGVDRIQGFLLSRPVPADRLAFVPAPRASAERAPGVA